MASPARVALAALLLALVGAGIACVIGPKQDDPVTAAPAADADLEDSGGLTVSDTGTGGGVDAGDHRPEDAAPDGVPPSISDGGDADAPDSDDAGDTSADAPEGG